MISNLKGWLLVVGIVLLASSFGLFGVVPPPSSVETLSAHQKTFVAVTRTGYYRSYSYWVFGASVIVLISAVAMNNK